MTYKIALGDFMSFVLKSCLFISFLYSSTIVAFEKKFDGYIVKLRSDSLVSSINSLKKFGDIKVINVSFGRYIEFYPNNQNSLLQTSLEEMRNHPAVDYIEPNYICTADEITDKDIIANLVPEEPPVPSYIKDPLFLYQWYLRNTGRRTWVKNSPPGVDLNILKAWKETLGQKSIIIATIDSGVNHKHKDLNQNLWVNHKEKNGIAGVDDDGNGFVDDIYGYDFRNNDGDAMDGLGHGTHVAGIIGASHNDLGMRGVMGKVQIMALKFLSDSGPGDSKNAARAIDYAVTHGAKIINNSWTSFGKSKFVFEAMKRARDAGIILTASAGNVKKDNDKYQRYPSNFELDNIIVVAGLNARDKKASYSNYGKKTVDVFAPGIKIISTDIKKPYLRRTGTSMSTPMVSGALGLLLSKYPGMKPLEAKRRLIETSIKNKDYKQYARGGRVDAYRLLMNITSK